MRKILFIVIVISSLGACKKNGAPLSSSIIGKWELRHIYGGLNSAYAAGNGNIYQFNRDGSFVYFRNGVQDEQGTYEYKKQAIQYGGQMNDEIIFNHETNISTRVVINGDKLTLDPTGPAVDGFISDYQKISN